MRVPVTGLMPVETWDSGRPQAAGSVTLHHAEAVGRLNDQMEFPQQLEVSVRDSAT